MNNNNSSRKLKEGDENPFDNIIYAFAEKTVPIFYKMKISPNQITLLSFIISILSIYYLCNHQLKLSALLWIISYFFDGLDGHMARKYNLVSKLGDF